MKYIKTFESFVNEDSVNERINVSKTIEEITEFFDKIGNEKIDVSFANSVNEAISVLRKDYSEAKKELDEIQDQEDEFAQAMWEYFRNDSQLEDITRMFDTDSFLTVISTVISGSLPSDSTQHEKDVDRFVGIIKQLGY